MKKISFKAACLVSAVLPICLTLTFAEALEPIQLSKPQVDGGRPLQENALLPLRGTGRKLISMSPPLMAFTFMMQRHTF